MMLMTTTVTFSLLIGLNTTLSQGIAGVFSKPWPHENLKQKIDGKEFIRILATLRGNSNPKNGHLPDAIVAGKAWYPLKSSDMPKLLDLYHTQPVRPYIARGSYVAGLEYRDKYHLMAAYSISERGPPFELA